MNRRGEAAESLAAAFLSGHGLAIVERNYQCRFGEIDLVAREGGTLVFVEVRRRRSGSFGGAAESITAAKRMHLLAAARHYLAHHARERMPPCRFDAVLVHGEPPRIEWIKDAFGE